MSSFTRFPSAAAAVMVVALIAASCATGQPTATVRPTATAQPTATPQPTATAQPSPTLPAATGSTKHPGEIPLDVGSYFSTPFVGDAANTCEPVPTAATPPPCDVTEDDTIRFTFTIPAQGWSGGPAQSVWLTADRSFAPAGAWMYFNRGYWLYGDPCRTPEDATAWPPEIPVGPTVDDFANALAEHPLLDVTAPVDVTLGGYSGKYLDLQVPADFSTCDAYWPWEGGGGAYAQGPAHQWHLWILDVEGLRVVVQATDYPGTSPQRQAELRSIVDSIQIEP